MTASRAYRWLLVAYPRWWREQHGEVVLGTLLEVDEAAGRTRPGLRDRLALLFDGLRVRVLERPRRFPAPLWDASDHRFDQSNGLDRESVVSAAEQERRNGQDRHDGSVGAAASTAAFVVGR